MNDTTSQLNKVATCRACGHTWNIDEDGGKRKRKCPKCGKYQITYSDPVDIDLTHDLDKNANKIIKKILKSDAETKNPQQKKGETETSEKEIPPLENKETQPEETQENARESETRTENEPKKGTSAITVMVILVIMGLITGIWCFLTARNCRNTQINDPYEDPENEIDLTPAWRMK